jgi:hypothetical protein
MHPVVFNVFEEICRARGIGGAVLEIGATPDASTLLNLPSLAGVRENWNQPGGGIPIQGLCNPGGRRQQHALFPG